MGDKNPLYEGDRAGGTDQSESAVKSGGGGWSDRSSPLRKVLASRTAKGDVLVFLDSHCEVSPGWLEPLLAPIEENPKR